jgi:hypothetical protein
VAAVVGSHLIGEVLHDLAVPDQQEIVVHGQHPGDRGEERPHVLVAMALAGRMVLGRGRPVERCRAGTVESMRWRTVSSGL